MHEVRSEEKMKRDVAMGQKQQQIQYRRAQIDRLKRSMGLDAS
jgi:hypothetical protein